MKLRGINGTISVEEYFNREVENFKNFIGDYEIAENEDLVEEFKHWINEDSDYVAIADNCDEIEEMAEEQEAYYNGCFNAAIEEIKKYFGI